jgi:hypothetical protein
MPIYEFEELDENWKHGFWGGGWGGACLIGDIWA